MSAQPHASEQPNDMPRAEAVALHIERELALVADFPEPGVLFRDLTPVFADGASLRLLADALTAPFAGRFDVIAGLEARGFLIAGAAAARTETGVLTVRKGGKLPRKVLSEAYALEYGKATLEVHVGELPPGTRVLIVDDVIATGGTANAAVSLIRRAGWDVAGVSVAIELDDLGGRTALADDVELFSLLRY